MGTRFNIHGLLPSGSYDIRGGGLGDTRPAFSLAQYQDAQVRAVDRRPILNHSGYRPSALRITRDRRADGYLVRLSWQVATRRLLYNCLFFACHRIVVRLAAELETGGVLYGGIRRGLLPFVRRPVYKTFLGGW